LSKLSYKERTISRTAKVDRLWLHPKLYVGKSPLDGYGVFTAGFIPKEEALEECHYIYVSRDNEKFGYDRMDNHIANLRGELPINIFSWPYGTNDNYVIPLGWGCIYNTSNRDGENNAYWVTDVENDLFIFRPTRDIEKGEEILTYYNYE